MNEKTLWYIADPMCSWCWGFSPVIEAIRCEYGVRLKMELLLGGLRPGTKEPMPSTQREAILRHWQAVHRLTGQPFRFEGAMPSGFIYDTEPASRGVVAASIINSDTVFPFFKAVQSAFYIEQQDVTTAVVLTRLAADTGLDAHHFLQVFESDIARSQTLGHFQEARQWGVHGFPAVIMQDATGCRVLTGGYRPLEELRLKLDNWLKG
ncbi:DsbA family protein [Nitrosospira lacus]|uniref:DsbA family protein n=1 Tax=Nitrosospira lacus TaxID=1288494 RepID=A0A1W6SRG7_9PROT|nr:DsbA family protein [Nitrosospira lacus]ARO88382.1 DsbA family protein [Nitrosospira lacus]